jgi:mersacidin/lichenicidin family type 2 lantibiotic
MSSIDTIRAWKDTEYRDGLTAAQQELLPEHPAGMIEIGEGVMDDVAGAAKISVLWTAICAEW